jgi:hypothetical protein
LPSSVAELLSTYLKNTATRDMSEDDSEKLFGNNPGKKRIEGPRDQPPITDNVDIENAVKLRFIEGLSQRVVELADEVQENIDQEANRPHRDTTKKSRYGSIRTALDNDLFLRILELDSNRLGFENGVAGRRQIY